MDKRLALTQKPAPNHSLLKRAATSWAALSIGLSAALPVAALAAAVTAAQTARAADEEIDYDAIVSDLNNQSQQRARAAGPSSGFSSGRSRAGFPSVRRESSLDDVLFHGGVGIANMFGTLAFPDGGRTYMNERGAQASLGIDLLSPEWVAEGSARSFSDADYVQNGVALKEFDLRVIYRPHLSENVVARMGAGLAARYLTVDRGGLGVFQYTTPASVGSLGVDVYLNQIFSVGAEASMRSALIAESVDQFSYDAAVRLDAHF